jgi:hypothetical protein
MGMLQLGEGGRILSAVVSEWVESRLKPEYYVSGSALPRFLKIIGKCTTTHLTFHVSTVFVIIDTPRYEGALLGVAYSADPDFFNVLALHLDHCLV